MTDNCIFMVYILKNKRREPPLIKGKIFETYYFGNVYLNPAPTSQLPPLPTFPLKWASQVPPPGGAGVTNAGVAGVAGAAS